MIRGLYCICDTSVSPDRDHLTLAKAFVAGGARIIQLRDKTGVLPEVARAIRELKRQHPFTFIINDSVDLALEVGADGLHIGADDLPLREARRRLGPDKIIGYSSHGLDEALCAEAEGADYVAFGAIFPTATKGPNHPIQGLSKLAEVCRRVKVPVVAIGGIGRNNVKQVLEVGAKGFAMISALTQARNVAKEVQWFAKL